jgi:carboxyl-terminal processing protease
VNIDKIGIPPDLEVKFPEFTEEDTAKLNELINSNRIPSFVAANPQAGSIQVENFAGVLSRDYKLDPQLLKRLIRNELNRTTIAPVYDLEYDVQLQKAVEILQNGSYRSLMRTTKTLKTLQEESLEDNVPLAS